MKGKDFFKWSFGLRFLFVFLCALMCVGNAWGNDINWDNYALDTCDQQEERVRG